MDLCKMGLKRANEIKNLNVFVQLLHAEALNQAQQADLHLRKGKC